VVAVEERVIKPPIEPVISGRKFGADPRYRLKVTLKFIFIALIIWGIYLLIFYGNEFVAFIARDLLPIVPWFLSDTWVVASQWFWAFMLPLLIIAIGWTNFYTKRIEYALIGMSGESIPEIYEKKGVFTIVEHHTPIRSITNVATRVGAIDRLFGIGTLRLETAGQSGRMPPTGLLTLILGSVFSSPTEERISGIRFYEEARNFVLRELRHFDTDPGMVAEDIQVRRRSVIFSPRTLQAFKEIRDAIKGGM
jgi:hypothetical protein